MKNRILLAAIYLSGFVCLYAFLAIRFVPLYNLVSTEKERPNYWDNTRYGELYYFNNIKHFRENLPPPLPKYQFSENHPVLEEAQVLTFGDSFMDFSRHVQLSSRLNDSLDVPVYYNYNVTPLRHLAKHHYSNDSPKYLLFVRTERWIPITFGKETNLFATKRVSGKSNSKNIIVKTLRKVRDFLFNESTEERYTALLQRSYPTNFFNTLINTLQFDMMGYVSSLTPEYALTNDRPWLFYIDQVNENEVTSFYYQHTDEEIDLMAENIQRFSDILWDQYKLKLLFLPIPAKYTIYHHIVNPYAQYNELLPRLYARMDSLGISYVNLLEPYRNAEEYVFYGTDDHWTEEGIQIATDKLLKHIRENKLFNELIMAKQ
jgi:hypothetical protein